MNRKMAVGVLLQGAKDMAPSWGKTEEAAAWCRAAGINPAEYAEALRYMAGSDETQRKVLMERLKKRLSTS